MALVSRLLIVWAVAALSAVVVAPAGAATVFGSALLGEPDQAPCEPEGLDPRSCTYAIGALPSTSWAAGGPVAPGAGVITSWAVKAGPSSGPEERALRLRVLRGDADIGAGYYERLPLSAGVYRFPARLSVDAGDRLGLDFSAAQPGEAPPVARTTPGASADFWAPPLERGSAATPTGTETDYELMLQATLEPDLDFDGWGDETQDDCIGFGLYGCSPRQAYIPPDPPETWVALDVSPRRKIHRTKVAFFFGSDRTDASFQCKLGRKPWKKCVSPTTYRGLRKGWHPFRVRAFDSQGIDPTPAKLFFKVELGRSYNSRSNQRSALGLSLYAGTSR